MWNKILSQYRKPWAILLFVMVGGCYGYFTSDFAKASKVVGDVYVRLLTTGVIPIIFSAVAMGIGRFMLDFKDRLNVVLKKILKMLVVSFVLLSMVGIVGAYLTLGLSKENIFGEHKAIYPVNRPAMGQLMSDEAPVELSLPLNDPCRTEKAKKDDKCKGLEAAAQKITNNVPQNIFEALSNFYPMQIVLFSILLGIAVGGVEVAKAHFAIQILEVVYDVFNKMVKSLLAWLPIGLFFMVSGMVAGLKENIIDIMQAMGLFIATFYFIGSVIVIFSSYIVWYYGNREVGFWRAAFTMEYLFKPVSTSFLTMSSFATMPVAIQIMHEKMGYDEKSTNLFLPLFLPMLRFGNAVYFMVAAAFFLVVYRPEFGINDAFSLSIASIVTSFSTIGTTSILAIHPVIALLNGLMLPSGIGFVLLLAIDTLVDPMRTTLIVHCNTAVTAYIADRQRNAHSKSGS